jgi:deazaflavin-dependent oxidoreductase (nitroreductase family)
MSEDKKGIRTFVKRFVNPILRNAAKLSFGPFALLRHVGRRSGKKYEIPIMVWPVEGGFVIELTYGRKVDWLRNLQAAGGGHIVRGGRTYELGPPRVVETDAAADPRARRLQDHSVQRHPAHHGGPGQQGRAEQNPLTAEAECARVALGRVIRVDPYVLGRQIRGEKTHAR